METKQCTRCGKTKDMSQFKGRKRIAPTKMCKTCRDYIVNYQTNGRTRPRRIEHTMIDGIESKCCSKCKIMMGIDSFYASAKNSDKLASACKLCTLKYSWPKHVKERVAKKKNAFRKRPEVKAKNNAYAKKYFAEVRSKDPAFSITSSLRTRLKNAVHACKGVKADKTLNILGCTVSFFREYLEERFTEGMTWENYGNKKGVRCWHLDHIKPCDAFDLTKEEDQRLCFHYFNLQPLWADDNISKGNKWSEEDEEIWAQLTIEGLELGGTDGDYEFFCL